MMFSINLVPVGIQKSCASMHNVLSHLLKLAPLIVFFCSLTVFKVFTFCSSYPSVCLLLPYEVNRNLILMNRTRHLSERAQIFLAYSILSTCPALSLTYIFHLQYN